MFMFDNKKLDESLTVGELQNKLLRFNRDTPIVVSTHSNNEDNPNPSYDIIDEKTLFDLDSSEKVCALEFDDSENSEWFLRSKLHDIPADGSNWSDEGKKAWRWVTEWIDNGDPDIVSYEDVIEKIADNFYESDWDHLVDDPEVIAIAEAISREYDLTHKFDLFMLNIENEDWEAWWSDSEVLDSVLDIARAIDYDDISEEQMQTGVHRALELRDINRRENGDESDTDVDESLNEATRPFFGPGSERRDEENLLLTRIKEFNEIWKNDKRLISLSDGDVERWWDIFRELLVSDSGRCDTLAGECISAFDYGFYRYANDGDWYYGFGDTYNESCRKSMNFLRDYVPQVGYISMNSTGDASEFRLAAYRAILSKVFSQEYFNRRDFDSWRSYPVRR